MKNNILEKILFAILFLYPFAEVLRIELGNGISFTAVDASVLILSLVWIVTGGVSSLRLSLPITRAIVLFVAIALISLVINSLWLNSSQFLISFLYLVRWVAYASIYFVVKEFSSVAKQRVLRGMILSGGMVVILGFIQFFLYPDLRNLYYAGWDEHLYRMFSTFLDPNFLGTFLSLYLTLLLGCVLFWKHKTKYRLLFVISSVVTAIALILTYSRGAYIMIGVSLVVLLLHQKRIKILALTIAFFGLIIIVTQLLPRSEGTNLLRIASVSARGDSIQTAIHIIEKNPIIGVGFNAYRYAQYRYGLLKEPEVGLSHSGAGTDNSFLFVFATTGIVGICLYIYLLIVLLKQTYCIQISGKKNIIAKTLAPVLIASLGGLVVNSFFINSLFFPLILVWIWILVGFMENN